jgi:hypothetical protein
MKVFLPSTTTNTLAGATNSRDGMPDFSDSSVAQLWICDENKRGGQGDGGQRSDPTPTSDQHTCTQTSLSYYRSGYVTCLHSQQELLQDCHHGFKSCLTRLVPT